MPTPAQRTKYNQRRRALYKDMRGVYLGSQTKPYLKLTARNLPRKSAAARANVKRKIVRKPARKRTKYAKGDMRNKRTTKPRRGRKKATPKQLAALRKARAAKRKKK